MIKKTLPTIACLLISVVLFAQNNSLAYYLETGINRSPLLKDYQNQLRINSIDSAKIRAGYQPQVMATTNNSYAPVINGRGYDDAVTNGRNIVATVNINKTFAGNRNLSSQFEAIRLQSSGIENTAMIAEQELKRTITAQYITTYGDEQQYQFMNETRRLLKEEDGVLKKLTQNNVYKQTDYLTFLVTLQQQELATRQALIQLQNDRATLNYLCGIVDTAAVHLEEPDIVIKEIPAPEQSVFFRQYTLDSLGFVNKRKQIDFSYKPKLSVFGDAGYLSSLAVTPYKNFGFNFGFSVSMPIYDGHQRRMAYASLSFMEQTRAHYKEFFRKQYDQQVLQLQQQLKATQELIGQINEQIRYAEGLIKAHTQLLATGDVKIADLVIALNNYLAARNLLKQNTISRWQIINQINYWNR